MSALSETLTVSHRIDSNEWATNSDIEQELESDTETETPIETETETPTKTETETQTKTETETQATIHNCDRDHHGNVVVKKTSTTETLTVCTNILPSSMLLTP